MSDKKTPVPVERGSKTPEKRSAPSEIDAFLRQAKAVAATRAAELVDGGSLYWVIKGSVQCRQRLLEVRPFVDGEGISRCHLMLEPVVVRTDWQPRRPFQGWRYLKQKEAPLDLGKGRKGVAEMPVKLRQELTELGLL